jgi:hypothetical protein
LYLFPSALPAQAKAGKPPPLEWPGTEGFRTLLHQLKLQPLASVGDLAKADPKRTLIVAFRGAEAKGRDPLNDINVLNFVQNGGAVLVATDQKTSGGWANDFDVQVYGTKVFAIGFPCYKDHASCPFVDEAAPDTVPRLFHSVSTPDRHLTNVATNLPSHLKSSNNLENVAYFSSLCREEAVKAPLRKPVLFAQQKRYDSGGKIFVMADHSVFINEMLLPAGRDDDNLEFTLNLLNWLSTTLDVTQPRDHVLFIDQTGKVETNFTALLQLAQPMPEFNNPKELLRFLWENREMLWENRDKLWAHRDMASELASSAEQSGLFQEIEGQLDEIVGSNIESWWIPKALLLFGLLIVFALSVRRFIAGRFRFPKAAPRLSMALDRSRPRGSLLDQRLRGSLRGGQCYEAARIRARQMFADLEWTPAEEGGNLPRVDIHAGWWQRRALARDLRSLWKIAFGAEPVLVQAKHWDKWLARLREIHKLIRDGVIRTS